MSDKVQLIKEEIERRIFNLEQLGDRKEIEIYFPTQFNFIKAYEGLLQFIEPLLKEPANETINGNYNERYKRIAQTEQFKKTYCDKSLWKEEPISEDLKEEVQAYLKDGTEFRLNDSNYVVDKHGWIIDGETAPDFARHFAEWQRKKDKESCEAESNCVTENNDLEEAAQEYSFNIPTQLEVDSVWKKETEQHFKDGAEWQKQQMMKGALDGCVTLIVKSDTSSRNLFISTPQLYKELQKYEEGDKLKIIIVKDD